jgi:hypothetical protein
MRTWEITTREVYETRWKIDAETQEEAVCLAHEGTGPRSEGIYQYTLTDETTARPAKVPVSGIILTRLEGRNDECDMPKVFVDWQNATARLQRWGLTAPSDGSYHKVRVEIQWADGTTHHARIDLHREDAPKIDLREEIRRELEFYAGRWCPPHLTDEQYRQCLTFYRAGSLDRYPHLLDDYDLGE